MATTTDTCLFLAFTRSRRQQPFRKPLHFIGNGQTDLASGCQFS